MASFTESRYPLSTPSSTYTPRSSNPSSRPSSPASTAPSSISLKDTPSPTVRIIDVSPRDGLQNISTPIPTATKIELIHRLHATGLRAIELTAAVSPKAVPQLSDAEEVLGDGSIRALIKKSGMVVDIDSESEILHLPVLVPNIKGLERALKHGVREVAVFVSASEEFSWANTRCSVEEGMRRAEDVAERAREEGVRVRGYISCIFTSPTGTPTPPSTVLSLCNSLLSAGIYEISLGDTLGTGIPSQTRTLISYLLQNNIPASVLAGHFHDTSGRAIVNVWAAYELGVRAFDASVAGLGGCPYAKGAKGNVATEEVVGLFESKGVETGVDLGKLRSVGEWVSGELGREYKYSAITETEGNIEDGGDNRDVVEGGICGSKERVEGWSVELAEDVSAQKTKRQWSPLKTWFPSLRALRLGFRLKIFWGQSR